MTRHYHLLGICGTAMASLAGLLRDCGYKVTGSDQDVYPPMSTFLESLSIAPCKGYGPQNLDPAPDVVVVGNAIPRGNPEMEAVLNRRMRYVSMPELLKELFLRERRPIVISGTHGKTTVTSLVSFLLHRAGKDPGFLIGGIARNFQSSFRVGAPPFFVIEGDEYDTAYFDKRAKFHHYLPECLIINYLEYDHADIYGTLDSVLLEFRRLVNTVPSGGLIVADADSPNALDVAKKAFSEVTTFGTSAAARWTLRDFRAEGTSCSFTMVCGGEALGRVELGIPGAFNAKNALAAAAAARWAGLEFDEIRDGLREYRGVMRRLELRGAPRGIAIYDDFAHHPTAIRATLEAVRSFGGCSRIWALFEPRSWTSRRNVHQKELPWAFEPADVTLLAGVFQVEKLAESIRLDPEAVVRDLRARGKEAFYMPETADMVSKITREASPGDIVVVMSNGGFENIHERLISALSEAPAGA